jgi:hypothetical protein
MILQRRVLCLGIVGTGEGPYLLSNLVVVVSVSRARIISFLPFNHKVVPRSDSVGSIFGVRPHENVLHVFQNERCLFDNVSFKGQKGVVNETDIPTPTGLVNHDVTHLI